MITLWTLADWNNNIWRILFNDYKEEGFWKHSRERRKCWYTSIFSFSHNVSTTSKAKIILYLLHLRCQSSTLAFNLVQSKVLSCHKEFNWEVAYYPESSDNALGVVWIDLHSLLYQSRRYRQKVRWKKKNIFYKTSLKIFYLNSFNSIWMAWKRILKTSSIRRRLWDQKGAWEIYK